MCSIDIDESKSMAYAAKYAGIKVCKSLDELYHEVDAVYIATPHLSHYENIKHAILAKKHVLCETPMVLTKAQAQELYQLAEDNGVILMEANKTAHCPAFNHLMVILNLVDRRGSLTIEARCLSFLTRMVESLILLRMNAGGVL